jgi:hypothetical protein
MIIANTNYSDTILKIEELKSLVLKLEESINKQIPKGIKNQFDNSMSKFLNSIDEIEITLIEFNNNIK